MSARTPTPTRVAALTECLQQEQIALWTDLPEAVRRALNGHWSMECDWIVERIILIARLVGISAADDLPERMLPLRDRLERGERITTNPDTENSL